MVDGPNRYARSRDGQVASIVLGQGPAVLSTKGTTGITPMRDPLCRAYTDRIAEFSRLILLDPRGVGRSDPLPPGQPGTVDEQAADLLAVLDDAGVDRAVLFT